MTNRNRELLASSSASGSPHLFPPGQEVCWGFFVSTVCPVFFCFFFNLLSLSVPCEPPSVLVAFFFLSCPKRLAGQWPWQVLQHICLKYARLQNLNFRTSGQYATLFTSLHSGDREKRNVLIGVPDNLFNALFLEYLTHLQDFLAAKACFCHV